MPPEQSPTRSPSDTPGPGYRPPPTFLDRVERGLLRVILIALVFLALLLGFASWHARQQRSAAQQNPVANAATTVSLLIDYGDGVRKTFTDLPASPGMTVLDAMNAAKSHARPIAFTTTGSGDTALLNSIDDLSNEGAAKHPGQSRAWQYWVDGAYGMTSIGAAKVNAGQRVSWAFRPYESDPKPPQP